MLCGTLDFKKEIIPDGPGLIRWALKMDGLPWEKIGSARDQRLNCLKMERDSWQKRAWPLAAESQQGKKDSALWPQGPESDNNLNELGSRFFPRPCRQEGSPTNTLIAHWWEPEQGAQSSIARPPDLQDCGIISGDCFKPQACGNLKIEG